MCQTNNTANAKQQQQRRRGLRLERTHHNGGCVDCVCACAFMCEMNRKWTRNPGAQHCTQYRNMLSSQCVMPKRHYRHYIRWHREHKRCKCREVIVHKRRTPILLHYVVFVYLFAILLSAVGEDVLMRFVADVRVNAM